MIDHLAFYLIEAALLAIFMMLACTFVIVLEHPRSPVRSRFQSAFFRRVMMGAAMGSTAIALIYSPIGQISGAHFNPAVTLSFFVLGKVSGIDTVFYIGAQFFGAIAGVQTARWVYRRAVSHESVNHAATNPGRFGPAVAWCAEFTIAFTLMSVVLAVSNHAHLNRLTGLFAGALVAMYITFEAPLSGMSMNPARTAGSNLFSRQLRHYWLYLTAPPAAMLLASLMFVQIAGSESVYCAKLCHPQHGPCHFRCRFAELQARANPSAPGGIQDGAKVHDASTTAAAKP